MDAQLRNIRKAIKRLGESKTYLTRRNALKAFDAGVKQLREAVGKEYPKLRKDGGTIEKPKKPRGCRCPVCNVPIKSFKVLVEHLKTKHSQHPTHCFCGKRCVSKKGRNTLDRHLAAQKDLAAHYAVSILEQTAKGIHKH